MESSLKDWLISKKIDPDRFKKSDPDRFATWEKEFEQMHPKSFTAQNLFLINPIRRNYPIKIDGEAKKVVKKTVKPIIKTK
ncbi:MAG: hypothetical protein LAT68_02985 [Cyclobacteriaceae bacterium]|nr:hypothetical protein [Cyclobacteriaceae bacterium]MCH8515271.1 hypothetical protein [Cyclobacteriaceae bacterium]